MSIPQFHSKAPRLVICFIGIFDISYRMAPFFSGWARNLFCFPGSTTHAAKRTLIRQRIGKIQNIWGSEVMFKHDLGRTASRNLARMAIAAAALAPVSAWSAFAVPVPSGSTADNPLLPVVIDNRWNFNFNTGPGTPRVFIDPVVAIGYNYFLNAGPNFGTVLLPTNIGDGIYDFWSFDSILGAFVDSGIDITGGQIYDFGGAGISRFSIRGIEVSAQLDPTDVTAFVTGLTFTGPGTVNMDMVAVTVDTTPSAIPLPNTLALVLAALLGSLCVHRSRKARVH